MTNSDKDLTNTLIESNAKHSKGLISKEEYMCIVKSVTRQLKENNLTAYGFALKS